MTTEQTNQPSDLNPTSPGTAPRTHWGRRLAIAAAVVFVISSVFPVVAGLSKDTASFPSWWGTLDVGIAFVLGALVIAIHVVAGSNPSKQAEEASYRAYRILIQAIFALLVVFFVSGDRVVWPNCLTGLAWRYWLLLYSLPAWFAALER
jgi:hypothetical protein